MRAAWWALVLVAGVARAETPRVVASAPWGSGPAELGRRGGDESAPEGPMSFAVSPSGDVFVLDQANRRVVVFGARGSRVIPVDHDSFQDLALGPKGELLLLDRLVGETLRVFAPDGTPRADVPIEGPGLPEGGLATALLVAPDGVWIEREHTDSVRLLDARLAAVPKRSIVEGRPLRRGGPVRARLIGRAVALALDGREATVTFGSDVSRIVTIEADRRGGLVVAAATMAGDEPGPIEIVRLGPDLRERRRFRTGRSLPPWEQARELAVGADGAIYQMAFTGSGVEVRRWDP